MTRVVNLREQKYDVYIGRGSVFGNPFIIDRDGTRAEVIKLYNDYFHRRLEDPDFKAQVLALRGKVLGCYCKPQPCHGDVIVSYLERET